MDEAQQNINLQETELQSIDDYLKRSKTSEMRKVHEPIMVGDILSTIR